jgi:F420-dependent oxidoreductase-like protein
MKLILQINDYSWADADPARLGPTLAEIAQVGERAGFSAICVADHLWQSHWLGGEYHNMLECHTVMTFLAAHTRRIELMALVTAAPYRPPGLLAKIVTSLDVLSGGRVWLGIGVGDEEPEARGLGLPYPALHERYAMLEETVQICLRMWSGAQGDEGAFEGTQYHLGRLLNLPQSLTRPHPPILIAGEGEQKTLRLVARYADACNLRPGPQIPHKLETLRRYCAEEGRDYDAIEKTCAFRFDVGANGSKVGELLDQLRGLAGLGIQTVTGAVLGADQITPLEIMEREVIPAVAGL